MISISQLLGVSVSAFMLMGVTAPCSKHDAGPAPAVLYDALGDGSLWFQTEDEASRSCPNGVADDEGVSKPRWVCHFNPVYFDVVDGRWVWRS